jgi:hypothetical protein
MGRKRYPHKGSDIGPSGSTIRIKAPNNRFSERTYAHLKVNLSKSKRVEAETSTCSFCLNPALQWVYGARDRGKVAACRTHLPELKKHLHPLYTGASR